MRYKLSKIMRGGQDGRFALFKGYADDGSLIRYIIIVDIHHSGSFDGDFYRFPNPAEARAEFERLLREREERESRD